MTDPDLAHRFRTAVFSLQEITFVELLEKCEFIQLVLASTANIEDEIKRRFHAVRTVGTAAIVNNIYPDYLPTIVTSDKIYECYLEYEDALLSVFSRRELSGTMTLAQMRIWIIKTLSLCYNIVEEAGVELSLFHMIPHEPCEFAFYCASRKLGIRIAMLNVTTAQYRAHFLCAGIDEFHLPRHPVEELGPEYSGIFSELTKDRIAKPYYEVLNHSKVSFSPSLRSLAFFVMIESVRLVLRYLIFKFGLLDRSYNESNMPDATIGFRNVTGYSKSLYRIRTTMEIYRTIKFLERHEVADIDFANEKYVYFPLHFQPEASTAPMGGIWENQFFLAKFIAESLPEGYKLLVKEHPSQFRFKLNSAKPIIKNQMSRSINFYESIIQLPKTLLVARSVDNTDLIDGAELICTITGTAGLEGFARGKKIAVFGPGCWYKQLEGIHFVKTTADFIRALTAYPLSQGQCRVNLMKLLSIFDANTFPVYQHQHTTEFGNSCVTEEFVDFLRGYCFSTTSKLD